MHYQAIVTRYHGPSNVRGARISATARAGRVYVEYDHRYNTQTNHDLAAQKLATKFDWFGSWVSGGLQTGDCVYVIVDKRAGLPDWQGFEAAFYVAPKVRP